MPTKQTYQQKIAVIGSGFAGLSAACYLAKGKEGGSQEAVSCLTKYFRLEEDNVVAETDPQLRSFIWFMESEGIAG